MLASVFFAGGFVMFLYGLHKLSTSIIIAGFLWMTAGVLKFMGM